MLKDPRKIFSITTVYDPDFVFPGAALPGPEPVYLTETKEYQGQTYYPGQVDPEWVKPDEEAIPLGEHEGRFWYSIRADISTEYEDLGSPIPEVDPQTHATVPSTVYDAMLNCSSVKDLEMRMGINSKNDRFAGMFPNASSLESALRENPEMVQQFLAQEAATNEEIMSKLGAVRAA
jgi:hypothetical protein